MGKVAVTAEPGKPGKETGMLLSGRNYIFIGWGVA